jgi:hypothetical protein
VVAHRIIYRREDRGNADIRAFVDWVTRTMADTPPQAAAAFSTPRLI